MKEFAIKINARTPLFIKLTEKETDLIASFKNGFNSILYFTFENSLN